VIIYTYPAKEQLRDALVSPTMTLN